MINTNSLIADYSDGRIYQQLFEYLGQEHSISPLESEMQDIIEIVIKNIDFQKLENDILSDKKKLIDYEIEAKNKNIGAWLKAFFFALLFFFIIYQLIRAFQ